MPKHTHIWVPIQVPSILMSRYRKRVTNTLICVLKVLCGRILVVELRNEVVIRGHLDNVDAFMKYVCMYVCITHLLTYSIPLYHSTAPLITYIICKFSAYMKSDVNLSLALSLSMCFVLYVYDWVTDSLIYSLMFSLTSLLTIVCMYVCMCMHVWSIGMFVTLVEISKNSRDREKGEGWQRSKYYGKVLI